ncbi:pyrroline-5-carboxylate reductase [Geminicoccaceae bacterium 1502E]|nr:pyrroline-5-carboxylate reductase [Geminicoccaceae bacterium 1502E]
MSEATTGPLLLVGAGKMGGAILEGWLRAGVPAASIHVVEPDAGRAAALHEAHGVVTATSLAAVPAELAPAALMLAVKPQTMAAVGPEAARLVAPETLVLSIAAGVTVAGFEAMLGPATSIVRCMPNTPASVGRGVSVLFANARVTAAQRALAERLMNAVGETLWIEDEEQMHLVTALSGGGPAYVFLVIEALAAAGERLGLPGELAERLARLTVCGSGELARLSDAPAARLRTDVTSPGGTTAEALRVLMAEDGLQPLLERALAAAAARSRELG